MRHRACLLSNAPAPARLPPSLACISLPPTQPLFTRPSWGATYLAACHWPAGKLPNGTAVPERFVGLIGEVNEDHNYWGRPEEDHVGVPRKAYVWQRGKHAASDMLGMVRPLHFGLLHQSAMNLGLC